MTMFLDAASMFNGLGAIVIEEQEENFEMDLTSKDICIKCDKGGNVLICCDGGCPLAVHEKCTGRPAQFDSMGNFYCPYCLYKRSVAELRQARENAMLRKKALSIFIDNETTDGDHHNLGDDGAGKKKETAFAENRSNCEKTMEENNVYILPCNVVEPSLSTDERANDFENQMQREPIVACGGDGECCREEGSTRQFAIVKFRVQADNQKQFDDNEHDRAYECEKETLQLVDASLVEKEPRTGTEIPEFRDEEEEEEKKEGGEEEEMMEKQVKETRNTICGGTGIISKRRRLIKQEDVLMEKHQNIGFPRRSNKKSQSKMKSRAVECKNVATTSTQSRHVEEASMQNMNSKIPMARRKKWSELEEEMLKEGVEKFSSTKNKNLPWRKILNFGHHVFNGTRTPDNLKDKWRSMTR